MRDQVFYLFFFLSYEEYSTRTLLFNTTRNVINISARTD